MFEYKTTEEFDIGTGHGKYEYDFFTINDEEDFRTLVRHYAAIYNRFNYFFDSIITVENNTKLSSVVQAKMEEHNANLCLTLVEKEFNENNVNIREMIMNEKKPNGEYDTHFLSFYHFATVRAKDHFVRGIAYAHSHLFNAAIKHFSRAIKLDPSMGLAFLHRGNLYLVTKEYDKAIEDFTQAININPEESVPFSFRGLAYKEAGDFDKARADFAKALDINPVDEETKKYFEEISKAK